MQNENVKQPSWVLQGLLWGILMFIIMAIAIPLVDGDQLQFGKVLMKLLLWLGMGLVYGYTLHLVERKKS